MSESRLTFVRKVSAGKYPKGLYKCICGNTTIAVMNAVDRLKTTSCGCRLKEVQKELPERNRTHGMSDTRLYGIWAGVKVRVTVPDRTRADRYVLRGITMCDEWFNSFEAFRDWSLSDGYADDLQLEREDNDGNYEPDNCRWITAQEQALNKGTTLYVEVQGKFLRLYDVWIKYADTEQIPYNHFTNRVIRYAWKLSDACKIPAGGKGFGNHYKGPRVKRTLYRKSKGEFVPHCRVLGYCKVEKLG